MPSAAQDDAAANEGGHFYPAPAGIGRALGTIAGIGMLFSPIPYFIANHDANSGETFQPDHVCEQYAVDYPDVDPTELNCPPRTDIPGDHPSRRS